MVLFGLIFSIITYTISYPLSRLRPPQAFSVTAITILLILGASVIQLLLESNNEWQGLELIASKPSLLGVDLTKYWLTGACTFAIYLSYQLYILKRWVAHSNPVWSGHLYDELEFATRSSKMKKMPALRLSTEAHSPVITGILKPTIILPEYAANWNSDTLRMVFLHELEHLQRKDLWVSLAAQITCILHWWNPFLWLLKRHLRDQCEFAVDARLISKGVNKKTYIQALCDVSEETLRHRPLLEPALSMAYRASLRSRVKSLLATSKK